MYPGCFIVVPLQAVSKVADCLRFLLQAAYICLKVPKGRMLPWDPVSTFPLRLATCFLVSCILRLANASVPSVVVLMPLKLSSANVSSRSSSSGSRVCTSCTLLRAGLGLYPDERCSGLFLSCERRCLARHVFSQCLLFWQQLQSEFFRAEFSVVVGSRAVGASLLFVETVSGVMLRVMEVLQAVISFV